ncbi:uncharacterized protein LOC126897322 isoform X2 [Daktulosphaira vitifoliae]|uniref:uncharacterized protein LOC126897322 isoform X2 n=1 Tax=Daktulosphaira vitifoliae TaxID=58002 RepID=UPI0021AAD552|nr:uncharacterized protein LOC126897322 isoform X2 [Daktulosphaira vitifoliae]
MFSLKLINFCFLLFSVILYTRAERISKKKVVMLDNLLKYLGWTNLVETHYIKYYNTDYYLQTLIDTPTCVTNGDIKIRTLTVYLGCSYAKIIDNIFFIIRIATKECKIAIDKKRHFIDGFICTEELIKIIISSIAPMATMMKSAMYTLDSLHSRPWATSCIHHYMVYSLLGKIGNILDDLNIETLSRDDKSTYYSTLEILHLFASKTLRDVKSETKNYCEFVLYDNKYLLNEWSNEYRALIEQNEKLLFIKFLTKKIKHYTKTVITEKYFQLGFKFDPITEETFLPDLTKGQLEIELEFKLLNEEPLISI